MTEEENEKERERIRCETIESNPEVYAKELESMEYKVICEVGREEWCAEMDAKSKGDWSAKEAGAYAEYCVFD
ncbi:DUF3012 domain-containing protein [Thalassotalea mangrovi]|uniref:DUF3012 domain-containing protein n=2 Tax=Thalassotalea mangrovi TaxID=2572245 RepID=A0A4U1B6P4_9GAMM|nr:DUF3012 domain-containing protein [Thalassotalea mangrovi]